MSKADRGKVLIMLNPSHSSISAMPNSLSTQERKPHIQADIFGNCSGMASLIPSKPPSLPFSPDLLAYSHLQVPSTGYLDCLWNLLCPSLRWHIVLILLPASWNAMLHSFVMLCFVFFFFPLFLLSPPLSFPFFFFSVLFLLPFLTYLTSPS